METKRAEGRKQVLTWWDEELLTKIQLGMRMAGYSDRSRFIRDAVVEKLQRLGIEVNPSLAAAPSRLGKGGPKIKAKQIGAVTNHGTIHQTFSPAASSSAAGAEKKGKGTARKGSEKRKRS